MASDNKLELVIEVDVVKGNASIKTLNTGLSSIEQAASKAARGASTGIDSITVSMAKGAVAGNLLADAFQSALSTAKSWTLEAVKMAAHEARAEAAGLALAKAHGIAAGAFAESVEAVRKVGYHGDEAVHTINRLIIADLALSNGVGLAKIAKDAAAIENIEAPEALEKLLQSIEFGNARALRSAGLRVDFVKDLALEELKLGRTLSDNETVQVRYNAVVRAAVAIQGAHAGAAGTAEAQMKALSRETDELREAIGAQFQAEYKKFAQTMRDFVGWAKDNVGALVPVAEAIKSIAIVIVAYEVAPKILSVVRALAAFRLAAIGAWVAANPFALIAAGVTAFGIVLWNEKKKLDQMNESLGETVKKAKVLDALRQGKNLAQMKEMGLSEDDVRAAFRGKTAIGGEPEGNFGSILPKLNIQTGPTAEDLKLAGEIRRKQMEAVRSSAEGALQAEQASTKGPAKALLEIQKDALKYSTFVDEKGVLHKFTLLAETRANLERELSAKVRAMQQEELAANLKEQQEVVQQRLAWESALYQKRLQYEVDVATQAREHLEQVYGFEEQRAGFARDAQMRAVDATDAQSLEQKLAVEQRKMGIEVEYLQRVHEIKVRLFDLETSRMVLEEQQRLTNLGYQAERINQRIGEISQQREDIRQQMSEQTDAAIGAARESAAIRQTQMVRDQNRQIFDSLKRQAEGVFDALLTKSQSIWSAIGNSLKTALLTAIKDVVSSRVAAMLMQLFTGQKVSFAGGGGGMGGGVLGGIGGMLGIGAVPVFGGGGSGATLPGMIPGMPGSTGIGGGGLSKAGLLGSLAGMKSMFWNSGGISLGAGSATTAAGIGGITGGLAGFATSPAGLMTGGLLAMSGLQRGGILGAGMTIGGGALTGAALGTMLFPGVGSALGAGIGALIGVGASIARMFVKSPEEKMRAKIKSTYGLEVRDKGILSQLVALAKSQYGNNYELALRSPQAREILDLYAQMTGQKFSGAVPKVTPVELIQTGGMLYQSPTYKNGTPYSFAGPLSTFGGGSALDITSGGMSSGAPLNITLKLDGPATTDLMEGRAVQVIIDNPKAVQTASNKATASSFGRFSAGANLLDPLAARI